MKVLAIAIGASVGLASSAMAQGPAVCLDEVAKLVPADTQPEDSFGSGLALDGDTLAVGARFWHPPFDEGVVYVYRRQGETWQEEAVLQGSLVAPQDCFGEAIAISGDTIVVGDFDKDFDIFDETGLAYVFVRNGTTWTEQATLLPPPHQYQMAWFGRSVAIDGDFLAVGAPGIDFPSPGGAVELFQRVGTQWSHVDTLSASDGENGDQFGSSIDIDGDRMLIGAFGADDACPQDPFCESGAAYVFHWNGSAWIEEAKLVANDAARSDFFGADVALGGDVAVAGAEFKNSVAPLAGATYVFRRSMNGWHQERKLLPTDGTASRDFGNNVAIHGDVLLVSSCSKEWPTVCAGTVNVYKDEAGTWPLVMKALSSSSFKGFGRPSDIQGDTILMGAPCESAAGSGSGAAYVYEITPASVVPSTYCTAKTNSCGTLPAIRMSGLPSATSGGGLFIRSSEMPAQKAGLLLYTNTGRASFPFAGGLLCIDPGNLNRAVPVVDTEGTQGCDGELAIDFNAFIAGSLGGNPQPFLLVPSTQVNCQYWGRDTLNHGPYLSDAVEFEICP